MTHIQALREVIDNLHGPHCHAFRKSTGKGNISGKDGMGIVEVFLLKGHLKTDRVYAWMHDTDDPTKPKRHVTVLHIPPVVSPKTAVQAAIIQEFRDAN